MTTNDRMNSDNYNIVVFDRTARVFWIGKYAERRSEDSMGRGEIRFVYSDWAIIPIRLGEMVDRLELNDPEKWRMDIRADWLPCDNYEHTGHPINPTWLRVEENDEQE